MPKKQLVIEHTRYIPALLNSVANKLATGASNTYRRRFGIGVTEWRILSLLATEPDCTAQRICEFFDLDKALVSRTLQTMTTAQIVKSSEDGRRRTTRLTHKGQALHDRIIVIALARERRLLSGFSAAEIATLSDFLGRLVVQVRKLNADNAKSRQTAATPVQRTTVARLPNKKKTARKAARKTARATASKRRAAAS